MPKPTQPTEFDRAWDITARAEGGYANHPNDPGGETMWGITARVARAHGYTGPMRELPKSTARAIAKRAYWDALRLDDVAALSPAIARELFDTNFNMGPRPAVRFLQRSLNGLSMRGERYPLLEVDGQLGPATLAALRAFLRWRGPAGETVLLRLLNALQAADYLRQAVEQPGKADFLFGWVLHRVRVD
jgi:lysozyme family protein